MLTLSLEGEDTWLEAELTIYRCQKSQLHLWCSELPLQFRGAVGPVRRFSHGNWKLHFGGKDEFLEHGVEGCPGDVHLVLPLSTALYILPGKMHKHGI